MHLQPPASYKVDHLEHQGDVKSESMEKTKAEYERQIAEMSGKMDSNAKEWSEEKASMEKEYKEKISDGQRQLHVNSLCNSVMVQVMPDTYTQPILIFQLLQKTYDDAWEQIRQASGTIDKLEKENGGLKTRVSALQKHNSSLLCAFALICGAYFPLLMRSRWLSQQRNILEEQLTRSALSARQNTSIFTTSIYNY